MITCINSQSDSFSLLFFPHTRNVCSHEVYIIMIALYFHIEIVGYYSSNIILRRKLSLKIAIMRMLISQTKKTLHKKLFIIT